ncbi:unnamed protein product [Vitrella brassicaformis CCMP3155]|uniref:Uncharacterized protein n=1 Tax=Vitrella brassicaformis (strain CCMP3155) TaxID=1169540 RepID=A0A0G4EH52_VITBC|nr:unnamed protein product [Vitrella brassicaformis CCMP3155]|eukprot:CEL95090.1 unnamed protein product [Vitrella brassicaformis CCMP3155]
MPMPNVATSGWPQGGSTTSHMQGRMQGHYQYNYGYGSADGRVCNYGTYEDTCTSPMSRTSTTDTYTCTYTPTGSSTPTDAPATLMGMTREELLEKFSKAKSLADVFPDTEDEKHLKQPQIWRTYALVSDVSGSCVLGEGVLMEVNSKGRGARKGTVMGVVLTDPSAGAVGWFPTSYGAMKQVNLFTPATERERQEGTELFANWWDVNTLGNPYGAVGLAMWVGLSHMPRFMQRQYEGLASTLTGGRLVVVCRGCDMVEWFVVSAPLFEGVIADNRARVPGYDRQISEWVIHST